MSEIGKKFQYDMALCILACAKNDKYKKRLVEFVNEYGFKLTGNHRIKFVFLVDDEPRPNFLDDRFHWYNCPGMSFSCRFLKYIKDAESDAEWVMQVDDDSSTDIDKTIEFLRDFYTSEDAMILMGGRNTDLELGQQNILRAMGSDNIFFGSNDISKFDTTPYFVHAWEPSILSCTAIDRIKAWSDLGRFYDLCVARKPTFSDQVPYVAAKLAKVPIVEGLFMSPFAKAHEYSAINPKGRFSHIHYITEKWPEYARFKSKMIKAKSGGVLAREEENLWEFSATDDGKYRHIGVIRLNPNGTVGIYENNNERYWVTKDDKMVLMDINKNPTSELKMISEKEYRGKFLLNHATIHTMRKI